MSLVRIALVGVGRWGKNLLRELAATSRLTTVCDAYAPNLDALKAQYACIESVTNNFDDVLADATLTAIVLATPIHTHHALATRALACRPNIALYVEKPLCCEVQQLADFAPCRLLFVGHLMLFHPVFCAVRKFLHERVADERVERIDFERGAYGPFNAGPILWDLGPHDVSMLFSLLPYCDVDDVLITSKLCTPNDVRVCCDVAMPVSDVESQLFTKATFTLSRFFAEKRSRVTITTSARVIVFDDTRSQVSHKAYWFERERPSTLFNVMKNEDIEEWVSPLEQEIRVFVHALEEQQHSVQSHQVGLSRASQVVRLLNKFDA